MNFSPYDRIFSTSTAGDAGDKSQVCGRISFPQPRKLSFSRLIFCGDSKVCIPICGLSGGFCKVAISTFHRRTLVITAVTPPPYRICVLPPHCISPPPYFCKVAISAFHSHTCQPTWDDREIERDIFFFRALEIQNFLYSRPEQGPRSLLLSRGNEHNIAQICPNSSSKFSWISLSKFSILAPKTTSPLGSALEINLLCDTYYIYDELTNELKNWNFLWWTRTLGLLSWPDKKTTHFQDIQGGGLSLKNGQTWIWVGMGNVWRVLITFKT